jgi:hypothetical protein
VVIGRRRRARLDVGDASDANGALVTDLHDHDHAGRTAWHRHELADRQVERGARDVGGAGPVTGRP